MYPKTPDLHPSPIFAHTTFATVDVFLLPLKLHKMQLETHQLPKNSIYWQNLFFFF